MGFPKHEFKFRGGCNCHAIRYRVSVPDISQRPDNPYDHPTPRSKLPMSVICHCNDCRRTHGQPMGFAMVLVLEYVELSLAPTDSVALSSKESGAAASSPQSRDAADEDRTWVAASSLFDMATGPNETATADSWLRFYRASANRARGFCGRCGTPLCYFVSGPAEILPSNWIPQLDVWMGTIDRCDLNDSAFMPDRELWADFGLNWAMDLVGHQVEPLPRFGTFK